MNEWGLPPSSPRNCQKLGGFGLHGWFATLPLEGTGGGRASSLEGTEKVRLRQIFSPLLKPALESQSPVDAQRREREAARKTSAKVQYIDNMEQQQQQQQQQQQADQLRRLRRRRRQQQRCPSDSSAKKTKLSTEDPAVEEPAAVVEEHANPQQQQQQQQQQPFVVAADTQLETEFATLRSLIPGIADLDEEDVSEVIK